MDEGFIKKVYRSIALAWAIAMTWSLAFQKPWIALSITLGTALGTAVLATYEWVIERAFVPGVAKPRRALLRLGLVKYPLICAMLYWLVRWDRVSLPAFCGGIFLVHFAIFAKCVGIEMVNRSGRQDTHAVIRGSIARGKES